MDKVTLATSAGVIRLFLISHIGTALIAIIAGTVAIAVAKGGKLHKQSGMVFSVTMIAAGFFAVVVAAYEGNSGSVVAGFLIAYFVYTAVTTVKPVAWSGRRVDVALMIFAFAVAAASYWYGVVAWNLPGHALKGVPAGMRFFMATVILLAAIGDARMIREGGLRGAPRIARHLWRMCYGLFIATGSFFIGQMKFIPEPIRFVPLLFTLGIAPLVILLYWMWRVRLRRRLTGIAIRSSEPMAVTPAHA